MIQQFTSCRWGRTLIAILKQDLILDERPFVTFTHLINPDGSLAVEGIE